MIDAATKSDNRSKPDRLNKSSSFKQQLRDVVAKIEITSDLTIVHPDYQPVVVAEQYQDYLKQISPIRDRYLTLKLQQYMYDIFMGRLESKLSAKNRSNSSQKDTKPQETINCGDRWYETQFYHQLIQCNHGRGYSNPDWLVVKQSAESWQVSKDGLTLNINPEQHLAHRTSKPEVGQMVSIKMPSSLIDRGVYIAVGDAGAIGDHSIVQLYFNVDSKTALILLDRLTKELNSLKISFSFKLPYQEADFRYLDAAILEFSSRDWQQLQPIIKSIYLDNQIGFQSSTPFFCRQLNLGLGLAEKPFLLLNNNLDNLGIYYCQVMAKGIIEMSKNSNTSQTSKVNYIIDYLSQHKINSDSLHLNHDSKAVYQCQF